jgi:hypothetical protein
VRASFWCWGRCLVRGSSPCRDPPAPAPEYSARWTSGCQANRLHGVGVGPVVYLGMQVSSNQPRGSPKLTAIVYWNPKKEVAKATNLVSRCSVSALVSALVTSCVRNPVVRPTSHFSSSTLRDVRATAPMNTRISGASPPLVTQTDPRECVPLVLCRAAAGGSIL